MKKRVKGLIIAGVILSIIGVGAFFAFPFLLRVLNSEYYGFMDFATGRNGTLGILSGIRQSAVQMDLVFWVWVSTAGLCALLSILHLVFIIRNKRPGGLLAMICYICVTLAACAFEVLMLTPNMLVSYQGVSDADKDFFSFSLAVTKAPTNPVGLVWVIIVFVFVGLLALGFLLTFIGEIVDIVYVAKSPKAPRRDYVTDSSEEAGVLVVHDSGAVGGAPSSEEIRSMMKEEMAAADRPSAADEFKGPRPEFPPSAGPANPMQGPFVIQYINTYSPEGGVKNKAGVPLSEIQGAITGEKPLTAEDIRKIVQETLAASAKKEPAQPVIVSVPAPAKEEAKEEPETVSKEEVRDIIAEEIRKALAGLTKEKEIVVEPEPAPSPELSESDIREIIRSELEAGRLSEDDDDKKEEERKALEEEKRALEEEKKALEEAHKAELEKARKEAAEQARREVEEEAARKAAEEAARREEIEKARKEAAEEAERKAAEEAARREEIEKARKEAAEQARREAEEEAARKAAEEAARREAEEALSAEEVRQIIQDELKESEKEPDAPRAVGEINPDLPPHDKIIRIPFQQRMKDADPELISNYNELKSEIMAYGVKSRISNSGDTFRLHKVTFVKITIAGKGLKLYFALNPNDYAGSTLPIIDAGNKGTYKDIPLAFKVKSDLSVRRAKQLIATVMEKNGLEQGKIEPHNWAAEIDVADDGDDDE